MHYTLYDVSLFLLQAMGIPMRSLCAIALARVIGLPTPVMHDHGNIGFQVKKRYWLSS